jgi:hypothetical protein
MKKKLFAAACLLAMSPAVWAVECADLVWGQAVLDVYPNVADACTEVVTDDAGNNYAKVNATFRRLSTSGNVSVRIQENDGDHRDFRFNPGAGATVDVDGTATPYRDLANTQAIRFYIPSDRFALLSDVTAAPMAAVPEPEPEPEAAPEPEPVPEPMPVELPTTAANTGIWLLSGILMLFAGLGLGVAARRRVYS